MTPAIYGRHSTQQSAPRQTRLITPVEMLWLRYSDEMHDWGSEVFRARRMGLPEPRPPTWTEITGKAGDDLAARTRFARSWPMSQAARELAALSPKRRRLQRLERMFERHAR
jgi:hypothetical protein